MEDLRTRANGIDRTTADHREKLALTLKTLGHPIRIGIMELLHENEELSVGEICRQMNSEQSLTSHHLKNMRLNGILKCNRRGKQVFYFLSTDELKKVIGFLKGMT